MTCTHVLVADTGRAAFFFFCPSPFLSCPPASRCGLLIPMRAGIMGDVRGQRDVQSPRQCLSLVETFALSLRDKYGAGCQALEEEHLDEAIEREVGRVDSPHTSAYGM